MIKTIAKIENPVINELIYDNYDLKILLKYKILRFLF